MKRLLKRMRFLIALCYSVKEVKFQLLKRCKILSRKCVDINNTFRS